MNSGGQQRFKRRRWLCKFPGSAAADPFYPGWLILTPALPRHPGAYSLLRGKRGGTSNNSPSHGRYRGRSRCSVYSPFQKQVSFYTTVSLKPPSGDIRKASSVPLWLSITCKTIARIFTGCFTVHFVPVPFFAGNFRAAPLNRYIFILN